MRDISNLLEEYNMVSIYTKKVQAFLDENPNLSVRLTDDGESMIKFKSTEFSLLSPSGMKISEKIAGKLGIKTIQVRTALHAIAWENSE